MDKHRFAPASHGERTVFGAQRPGYSSPSVDPDQVQAWISFMKERGIRRVCCLLSRDQLGGYQEDLLQAYRRAFGEHKVCWSPIEDFHLITQEALDQTILPFLRQADRQGEPVVVHCSGGIGRTGHVLALWLAIERGYPIPKALAAVQETGRNPFEALEAGCATAKELRALFGAPA